MGKYAIILQKYIIFVVFKIVFKKAQCVLVKDPFSVAGGCLFLANLLLALWTIGPRCACDAVRAEASSGRLVPPRQEEFWEGFLDISCMYLRSPHGLVMEDHAVAIAIKALWRQVTWHGMCIFSSISANLPPTADLLAFLVIDLDFRGKKTTTLMWVQRMEIKLGHI